MNPPPLRRRRASWKRLGAELQAFAERFPVQARRASDPVQLAHEHRRPEDREIVAYLAAMLAFGRVASLLPKARRLLQVLGDRPARALRDGRPKVPRGWTHRWIGRGDAQWLLEAVGRVLREDGSLGAAVLAAARPGAGDLLEPMAALTERLRAAAPGPADTQGRRWLAPSADGTGAAKRLCLLFRWMVRPADGVDLGLWSELGPERLTVALDTHVARIGRYVGLTERRSPGWSMAREITANLARLRPEDPTAFDFALSHLGIMGACPRRRRPAACAACDLVRVCRL